MNIDKQINKSLNKIIKMPLTKCLFRNEKDDKIFILYFE